MQKLYFRQKGGAADAIRLRKGVESKYTVLDFYRKGGYFVFEVKEKIDIHSRLGYHPYAKTGKKPEFAI